MRAASLLCVLCIQSLEASKPSVPEFTVVFRVGTPRPTPRPVPWPPGSLCRRLYLQGLDPSLVGHVQASGLYHLVQQLHWSDFPVYRLEDKDIYLYYDAPSQELHLGLDVGRDYFGLGATTHRAVLPGPLWKWIQQDTARYPFLSIIDNWFAHDYANRSNRLLGPNSIHLYCADGEDDHLQRCTSGRVYLNASLVLITAYNTQVLIEPQRHFFEELPSLSLRPRYQLRGLLNEELYLLHDETQGVWSVGPSYHTAEGSLLRVKDPALSAEFITGTWEKLYKSRWYTEFDLAVKCKGAMEKWNSSCDKARPCAHNGLCYVNDLAELVCRCAQGFRGPTCEEEVPPCEKPVTTSRNVIYDDHVATTFCDQPTHAQPAYWFSVCQHPHGNQTSARWLRLGSCKEPATTTNFPNTSSSSTSPPNVTYVVHPALDPRESKAEEDRELMRWLADNSRWVVSVGVAASLMVQVLVPVAVWLFQLTRACKRLDAEGKDSAREDQDIVAAAEARLDAFHCDHPEPEAEYTDDVKEELTSILAQHISALEKVESRDSGGRKSPSFCRIASLYFSVSLWLWLVFVVTCEALGLTGRSAVLHCLVVVAILVIVALHVCVLIETYRSRERRHLVRLAETQPLAELVAELRQRQPEFIMSAECWHRDTGLCDTQSGSSKVPAMKGVKVVTSHVVKPLKFSCWLDASHTPKAKDATAGSISVVKVYTLVAAGDGSTQNYIQQQFQDFCKKSQHKDKVKDFVMKRGVSRVPTQLRCAAEGRAPWWASEAALWVLAALGLTWPHRALISCRTRHSTCVLYKKVYAGTPDHPALAQACSPYDNMAGGQVSPQVSIDVHGED